jgi:hypothetical protein
VLISVIALITIVITAVLDVAATSKVITAAVVTVVIASWRVRCFTGALVQQLLGIVVIHILLGGGEEVNHRYRLFMKELVLEVIVVAQTCDEGFDSLIFSDPGDPDAHIREASDVLAQWFVPSVVDALKVVLVVWLFTGSNEVFDKGSTQSILGVEVFSRRLTSHWCPTG